MKLKGNYKYISIISTVLIFLFAIQLASATISSITVIAPNGAEDWSGTQSVTWSSVNCNSSTPDGINIYWGKGGTIGSPETSGTIATSLNCSLENYSWDTTGRTNGTDYQIRVRATADSDVYDYSNAIFTIDNAVPTTTIVNSSSNTTDTTPSITFNYTDVISNTASCVLYFDDVSVATNATVTKDTDTTLTTSPAQDEGSYTVYVNCTDESGNIDKSGEITVIIDGTGPTIIVTNPVDQSYIDGDSIDKINGTVSDALTSVDNVTLHIYNGSKYYNTTGFGSDAIVWLNATLSGSNWNYTSPTWVETLTYNVTVRATDALGNTGTSVIREFIDDSISPTVSSVNSTKTNGSYNAGEVINVTILFNEAVTVTGAPLLELELGTTDRNATYIAGTGTTTLIFNYTVQADDTSADLDYTDNAALALNSGTINDAAGNAATLTLAEPAAADSLGANKAIVIDTTVPVVGMINSSFSTTNLTPSITFNYSDSVTAATCSLYFNGISVANNATVVNDTNTILIATSQTTNTNYSVYVNCTDLAGNIGQSSSIYVDIDTAASTVSSVNSTKADGSYKVGEVINVTILFNEAVTVTGAPLLELELGTTDRNATYIDGTGTTTLIFNYTVQASDTSADLDYTDNAALALNSGTINDAAGNVATLTLAEPAAADSLGANKAIIIDTTASTVTRVNSTKADGSYKVGEIINVTILFNEVLTVTGTPILELELGDTDRNISYIAGTGTTTLTFNYTVQAGDTSADLDYTDNAALALNSGTINDAAGNAATLTLAEPAAADSLGANKAIIIDTTAPTFSNFLKSTASNVKSGDIIWIAFNSSETLLSNPTVTVGTLAMSNVTATGYGYNYSRTLNGSETEGTATVSITGLDVASNTGTNVANNFTTDFTKPIVSAVSYNDTEPFNNGTVQITVNMSEAVSTVPKIAIDAPGTGGDITATDITNTGNDIDFLYNYTINSTNGTANITITIAADSAGNTMNADTNYSFTIDTTVPTLSPVSIASNNTNTTLSKVEDRVTITFTASEDIGTPVVTIDGNAADAVTNTSGATAWSAYRDMQAGDTEGAIAFTIDFNDSVSNVGVQVTATTDSSSVLFDETNPVAAITEVSESWVVSDIVNISCTDAGSGCNETIWYYYDADGTCAATKVTYTSNTTDSTITINSDHSDYLCIWVQDNAGNTDTNASIQLQIDTASPTISSGTYTHSTRVLNLTFDDTLTTVNVSRISIAKDAAGTSEFNLSTDVCTNTSTNVICTLTTTNRDTISGWDGAGTTTLYAFVSAGTVKDKASQDNTAGNTSLTWTKDEVAPTYASNTYDAGTGILIITLSENLIAGTSNVNLSKIYIVGSDATVRYLTGSTVDSVSTTTATITLSSTIKTWLNGLTFASSYLRFDAGAMQDLGTNSIAANTGDNGIIVDSTKPALSSVTSYDYATRQLTLVFNETIKYSLVNVSDITLGTTAVTGGNSITLTGAAVTTSSNDETIVITLTTAQRDIIQDTFVTPSALYVRLAATAVTDLADNTNDALSTGIVTSTITHKDQIALSSGWNLVSTPYAMATAKDTFAELLSGYDYTIYEYSGGSWNQPTAVNPLYGYLVNVNQSGVISLSYTTDVNQSLPQSRSLNSRAWYTIGASTRTTETASTLLNSTNYHHPYIAFMENGAYNSIDNTGTMEFGRGYWLFAEGSTFIVGRLYE